MCRPYIYFRCSEPSTRRANPSAASNVRRKTVARFSPRSAHTDNANNRLLEGTLTVTIAPQSTATTVCVLDPARASFANDSLKPSNEVASAAIRAPSTLPCPFAWAKALPSINDRLANLTELDAADSLSNTFKHCCCSAIRPLCWAELGSAWVEMTSIFS